MTTADTFAAVSARPAPPGPVHALRVLWVLGCRKLVMSRKTLVVALLGLVLAATVLLYRVLLALHWLPGVSADAIFALLVTETFLRFFLPVVSLFYGAALVTDEVDGRTITYLTTRPIDKRLILCGKFSAFATVAVTVLLTTLFICWLGMATASGLGGLATHARLLLQDGAVVVLGIFAYGGFFTLLGAWLRKPVIPGLVFAFVWEQFASFLPGSVQRLTILHYLQSLTPHAMAPSDELSFLSSLLAKEHPLVAVAVLLAMGAGFTALAAQVFREKEYRLEK